jgi:hypothetical protein
MANDINSVYIQVVADTSEVQRNMTAAEKAFLKFMATQKKTGRQSKSITTSMLKLGAGIFAIDKAASMAAGAFRRMVSDVSAFQVMSVELKVATGSVVQADAAFAMLQKTAKILPSSLRDLTTGFVRLKNMGLDASSDSLVSFSNTAAAMGKSLKQFVEAVADANTREFERLKEFGILARNEGEKIRFVFRGVTTEVDNSSADIVKFLTDIGHTEFAGAATEQIDTLAARFTKLQDSIFNLNIAFGEGATGVLGDFVKFLTEKADAAAFNKGLSDIKKNMMEVQTIATSSNFAAAFGGPSTQLVRKRGAALRAVFRKLGSNEFEAADKILADQLEKVERITDETSELYKGEKRRYDLMLSGLNIAKARVQKAQDEAKAISDNNAANALAARQAALRAQIEEHRDNEARDRLFEYAKAEGDIATLKKLKAEEAAKLIPIDITLARLADEGKASEEQMKKQLAGRAAITKEIASIQSAIAKLAGDEARERRETLKVLKEEREERMKSMAKQMEAVMEVGNAIDYNADREAKRAMEAKLSTAEGTELLGILGDKYNDLGYQIEETQALLKEEGLGAKEIIDANDKLDELNAEYVNTGKQIQEVKDKAAESAREMKELFDDVREGIADAIVEGESFKGVLESILKQIAKTNLLKALGGKDGTGGISGFLSGLFRARGGPVTANQPYIVGERGPELFTPSGSGSITPNNRLTSGSSGDVNVVNHFTISGGVDQQTQSMIAQSVSTSVQLAVSKIQDNKRRRIS